MITVSCDVCGATVPDETNGTCDLRLGSQNFRFQCCEGCRPKISGVVVELLLDPERMVKLDARPKRM